MGTRSDVPSSDGPSDTRSEALLHRDRLREATTSGGTMADPPTTHPKVAGRALRSDVPSSDGPSDTRSEVLLHRDRLREATTSGGTMADPPTTNPKVAGRAP